MKSNFDKMMKHDKSTQNVVNAQMMMPRIIKETNEAKARSNKGPYH